MDVFPSDTIYVVGGAVPPQPPTLYLQVPPELSHPGHGWCGGDFEESSGIHWYGHVISIEELPPPCRWRTGGPEKGFGDGDTRNEWKQKIREKLKK